MVFKCNVLRFCQLIVQFFFVVFSATCFAQESSPPLKQGDRVMMYFKVPPKDGEFRKEVSTGSLTIGCDRVAKAGEKNPFEEGGLGYGYCLRIGPMILGMEFFRLQIALTNLKQIPEAYITKARIINTTGDGVRTLLIPLTTQFMDGKTHLLSYLVVLMDDKGIVRGLQLTGKPDSITENLPFSSIKLGASKDRVVDILGNPSSISNIPDMNGKLWNYAPFPISIEIVNGVVYSVRLDTPRDVDKDKGFKPMETVPD
jgi:hypothetical protein